MAKRSILVCDWCETERRCEDEMEEMDALADGWMFVMMAVVDEPVTKAYCSDECIRRDLNA